MIKTTKFDLDKGILFGIISSVKSVKELSTILIFKFKKVLIFFKI